MSINNDNRLDKVDCDVHIRCCKNKTCPCDKYLNNFGNESLFSDVTFHIGNPNVPGQSGWDKCSRKRDREGGKCTEFGQTGNFYHYPENYAKICDYPVKTLFQKQSFRPS